MEHDDAVVIEVEAEFADGRTLTLPVDEANGDVMTPPVDMGYGVIVRYRSVAVWPDGHASPGEWVRLL